MTDEQYDDLPFPFSRVGQSDDELDELPAPPRKDIPEADRELLELAARALGARFEEVDGEGYGNLHFEDGSVVYGWNSLLFSGDALELSVRLRLDVSYFDEWVDAGDAREEYGDNKLAATCRAITCEAASIGKVKV